MARMRLPKSARLPIESDRCRALIDQFDKIASRSNHGYIKTRRSHYFTFKRFLAFLSDHSGVSDMRSIEPKHVSMFLAQESASKPLDSVLRSVSAIRFWYKQIPGRRYDIPKNGELIAGVDDKNQRRYRRL
jgi:site-specific recombinase XerD